jgi:hypothetical protein
MSLRPKLYGLFLTSGSLLASVRHHPVFVSSAPLMDTPDEVHDSVIWSDGAIHEIYNWLKCDDYHVSDASKVPDAASWRLLHETYEHILPYSTKLPPLDQERTSGYHVPIEVKEKWDESGDEEVGIYTTNAIPSGTLVWTSTYTAHFDSGDDFRAFARALPKTLACHVLYWVFPRYLQDEPVVCVDLDHGSFMDVCNKNEACNLHFSPEHYRKDSGCQMDLYASRDIAAGEQLLLDHDYAQDMEALVPLGLVYEDQLPKEDGEDHDEGNDDDEYETEEEL